MADGKKPLERREADAQTCERSRPAVDQKRVNIADPELFVPEEPVDHGEEILRVFHIAFDRGVAELAPASLDRDAQDRA